MKTIGIIGGLSPESTSLYYKKINELIAKRLGGHSSAKIILISANFAEFCALKEKGDWDTQAQLLSDYASSLENAGADFIILATNTMHKMAGDIESSISVPFLHIADATAHNILQENLNCVGLLGTKYTMELDFYKDRLKEKGIKTLVPDHADDRAMISDIIYNKLTKNIIDEESERVYVRVIEDLKLQGAQAVILGCTEITMLINQDNSPLPVLDTTLIHVEKAVNFALS